MNILDTPVADLKIVQSLPHRDARGAFVRLFCTQELQLLLGSRQIAQINHSKTSHAGTVRGLHFQRPPHAEMKMVRCLPCRVCDVAVDLRSGSPTFVQWHAQELAQDDAKMLVIPEGFAHGFQALEPESEFLYLDTRSTTRLPRAAFVTTTHGSPSPGHCRRRICHLVAWPIRC
jgi:dTDP-4-dehydrorhamnose 3,5-epimerase